MEFEQWLDAQPDFLVLNERAAADERERIARIFDGIGIRMSTGDVAKRIRASA